MQEHSSPFLSASPEGLFPEESRLQAAYRIAQEQLAERFPRSIVKLWAREVADLASGGADARDAVAELLEATPKMAQLSSASTFQRWLTLGREVASQAPAAQAAFYHASPPMLAQSGSRRLPRWVDLGLEWVRRDRSGGEWAAAFFQVSPALFSVANWQEVERLVGVLLPLAWEGVMEPQPAFQAVLQGFGVLRPRERRRSLAAGERVAQVNPWALGLYVQVGLVHLAQLPQDAVGEVLPDLVQVAELPSQQPPRYWQEVTLCISKLPTSHIGPLLQWALRLGERSATAGQELLRGGAPLAVYLTVDGLDRWCEQGMDILRLDEAEGVTYFRLQSQLAKDSLTRFSTGVSLRGVREVLRLYSQALMGRSISVLPVEAPKGDPHGWVRGEASDWEQAAIFAPSFFNEFSTKDANFEALKVLVTHQAGHLAFGTYEFDFDAEGSVFRPLRHRLTASGGEDTKSAYRRFFDLFADNQLAQTLFTVAEDARIDALLFQEYRGIREPYRRIQQYSLNQRPSLMGLALREYLVELLVHFSLAPGTAYLAPRPYAPVFMAAAGILSCLLREGVVPEDVVEASFRLYILARQVPNLPAVVIPSDQWVRLRLSDAQYNPDDEDLDELVEAFKKLDRVAVPVPQESQEGEGEQPFTPPPPVTYRWDPRPDVMQTLLHLLQQESESNDELPPETPAPPKALLKELFAKIDPTQAPDAVLEWEAVDPHQARRSQEQTSPSDIHQASPLVGSVAEGEVQVFFYDEWDYRLHTYRPAWCQVNQRVLKARAHAFYQDTLDEYGLLVNAIRKQFEMLRSEGLTRVKRLLDGEEIDIDAAIESLVDRHAGHGLMDKIYWRRRKAQRSVAVAVLMDMSLSTDERVDPAFEGRPGVTGSRRTFSPPSMQVNASRGKRIIQLEKESLVLLTEALERLGDQYGIYGFSSAGRGDVQFYVVKGLSEAGSAVTKARIGSIVPLQGTRMGAAIRHTITHLQQADARTKVLLLLSDGRPQDRDYGAVPWEMERPFVGRFRPADATLRNLRASGSMADEQEYAVHDTKQALNEAKTKGIVPFCLSIDKGGYDYLREMCEDIGYEVVSDIEMLPRRLPSLYRRLTT